MLLVVLAIGGTLLGATTLGGMLLAYQIRQSADLANSTRAIFAADAGLEWALKVFVTTDQSIPPPVSFSNGATVRIECLDGANNRLEDAGVPACWDGNTRVFRSLGTYSGVSRALELNFRTP